MLGWFFVLGCRPWGEELWPFGSTWVTLRRTGFGGSKDNYGLGDGWLPSQLSLQVTVSRELGFTGPTHCVTHRRDVGQQMVPKRGRKKPGVTLGDLCSGSLGTRSCRLLGQCGYHLDALWISSTLFLLISSCVTSLGNE
jgi:hypothetical protein